MALAGGPIVVEMNCQKADLLDLIAEGQNAQQQIPLNHIA